MQPETKINPADAPRVLRIADAPLPEITRLLERYGLQLKLIPPEQAIEGSYWGDDEAGLVGRSLVFREDTPVHSLLHEACHYVCMDKDRRDGLHTDAGGDYDEENAVCYLQIILAQCLGFMGGDRMFHDMDQWGYSFRLGSARRWFEEDAADARQWLLAEGLIGHNGSPSWKLRGEDA